MVSVGPACALPARPYWKFRGRELQSATGRSASLDHESGTLYLLIVRDTNSSLRFRKLLKAFLFVWRPRRRDGVELAPLNGLTHSLTYLLTYLLTYRWTSARRSIADRWVTVKSVMRLRNVLDGCDDSIPSRDDIACTASVAGKLFAQPRMRNHALKAELRLDVEDFLWICCTTSCMGSSGMLPSCCTAVRLLVDLLWILSNSLLHNKSTTRNVGQCPTRWPPCRI